VLIVSGDAFNDLPSTVPLCVPLVRTHAEDHLSDWVVTTHENDPVSGSFHLPYVRMVNLDGGQPLGLITGATVQKVTEGLTSLFSY
jgi:mRNA-degrading endonuclease toxin of MazEF toxin-antitoxin module